MSDKCCVPNCRNTRADNIILHKFPNPKNQAERFRLWIYAIGGDILSMDNTDIFKKRRVCHNHFEGQYHTSSTRLTYNAVPSLNLSGQLRRKRRPLAEIPINVTEDTIKIQQQPMRDGNNQNVMPSLAAGPSSIVRKRKARDIENPEISLAKKPRTGSSDISLKGSKSSKKRKLYSEDNMLYKSLKKLKLDNNNLKQRLAKAKTFMENLTFQRALKKFTTMAMIFTLLQFREINKPKMARRYTKEEKVMALSFYKQGPRSYRWYSKLFVLPSPITLSRLVSKAAINPGMNEKLFKIIKKRALKMREEEKLVILLFDEVAIMPHLDYNRKEDKIVGFVDDGKNMKKKIADHALVFMIRGVQKNFKLPISYTFCSGSTHKAELSGQITEIIQKLHSIGLKVVATVCDQGASNMSAINVLLNETRQKYLNKNQECKQNVFEIDGAEIVPLFDPPHLIKGIRNNLLTKNLICHIDGQKKTAKWADIMAFYEEDPSYKGLRLVKKLSEEHVNPKKISKMKVKCATQVFSRTVGINMGYLADKNILPIDSKQTADVLLFFDDLFDSVNGNYENFKIKQGKPLLAPMTLFSKHLKFWYEAKSILKSMKYVTKTGKEGSVPSINNWLRTLENFEYLTTQLFTKYALKSIWLRHFNQDPLENFFGSIRSHAHRSNNPTCVAFESAYVSLLINNLSSRHSPGSNCEEDSCKPLFKSLKGLIFDKSINIAVTSPPIELDYEDICNENIITDFDSKTTDPRVMAQLQYVTGYILRESKRNLCKNCSTCLNALQNSNDLCGYIKLREYKSGKRSLSYASNDFVKCFSEMQDIICHILKTKSDTYEIKNYIKTVICVRVNFNFIVCDNHKKELINYIQELTCRFFICNWCRDVNKILSGTRFNNDPHDDIKKMAALYYNKRKK